MYESVYRGKSNNKRKRLRARKYGANMTANMGVNHYEYMYISA